MFTFLSGSFSRSAVNYNAGAQTVVSNIIMASAVLVTLLFLMPLFYYTPNVILAAIIITAVSGLIDYQAALRLWKVDKLDFLTCMCSFFGVLFISVPLGLAIAVRFPYFSSSVFCFQVAKESKIIVYLLSVSNISVVQFRLEYQSSRFSFTSPGQTPWF